jgi:uncharacterized repeat protein (TIGR03803 family)
MTKVVIVLCVIVAGLAVRPAHAQKFQVLHKFAGGTTDGASPFFATLVRDATGNLYGTTMSGGAFNYGVVFKVAASGGETVLYNFRGGTADGCNPVGGLLQDAAGELYGTTIACGASGFGTVFKVDTGGMETVLYSFDGGTDGAFPEGNLVADDAGTLYGITDGGGDSSCSSNGCGTVIKLDISEKETVLHRFTGSDGQYPVAGLLRDSKGNLYGTTEEGGAKGVGTVFKLDTTGAETALHSFPAFLGDGESPEGTLIQDTEGNLYGTTSSGGGYSNGTVFRLDTKRKETLLYTFVRRLGGTTPYVGLVRDVKGDLYGVAAFGGVVNDGTVFKLGKSGKESILHSFKGTDGAIPYSSLIRDAEGNFYGTTSEGGNPACESGCGVVFKITP